VGILRESYWGVKYSNYDDYLVDDYATQHIFPPQIKSEGE